MLDLPGYIIRDEIFEGFRTKVYRGWSVKACTGSHKGAKARDSFAF